MNKVTASESIVIHAPVEAVWDFTQNWDHRTRWDWSVAEADYLTRAHPVTIAVRGRGGLRFKVTYKTSERPRLTTLVMSELDTFFLQGGGGSWKYESQGGATKWTQHNTLVLSDGYLGRWLRPLFATMLTLTTRSIMKRAKKIVEGSSD